jgi:hypothetical protein
LNLKFYNLVASLLEASISPFVSRSQDVHAASGTNLGMTTGNINNTFPSSVKSFDVTLPGKRRKIKKLKKKD